MQTLLVPAFNTTAVGHPMAMASLVGFEERCTSLSGMSFTNTTILEAAYVPSGTTLDTPEGSCQATALTETSLCRVYFSTRTTESSDIHAEAWLPDEWYGRFMVIGNGGLGGCVDYDDLSYGSLMHFAVVASDNGHSGGDSGQDFLNHPEVINDFGHRSIHTMASIGKEITNAYYHPSKLTKSYYLGCSTGGRQGTQAALRYPEDFDGILAGSPATDFHHLIGWLGLMTSYIGALDPNGAESSPSYISQDLWAVITQEILSRCDALDGIMDDIISDPEACDFKPEELLCPEPRAVKGESENCLTIDQVEALRKIYEPLYGPDGKLIYPRYEPGAEATYRVIFNGSFFPYANGWWRYAVYNDSNHDFANFSVRDIYLADSLDPGQIRTFSGNMSAFMDRGGKFLTYHGTRDGLISLGKSKRFYKLISQTLSLPTLDPFYRLFVVPGMDHCCCGLGPSLFGQHRQAFPPLSSHANDSDHNILLALIDWVEGGVPPDEIIGLYGDGSGKERRICRYPLQSRWDGSDFVCI